MGFLVLFNSNQSFRTSQKIIESRDLFKSLSKNNIHVLLLEYGSNNQAGKETTHHKNQFTRFRLNEV